MMKRLHRTNPAFLMVLLTLGAAVPLSLSSVTGGALSGAWWIPISISIGLGYASARLLPPLRAIPVAAAAPATAVCLVILIKVLVWPHVPAVGDGFHVLVMIFAGAGALTAVMTLVTMRASSAPDRIVR